MPGACCENCVYTVTDENGGLCPTPKNITISIPDDLAKKMAKLTDVNWSAVCKECIGSYVDKRLSSDIEALISRLQEEKGKIDLESVNEAAAWAKNRSFKEIEEVLNGWKKVEKDVYDRFYSKQTPSADERLDTYFERVYEKARRDYWRRISGNDTAGDAYLQGFQDYVMEIHQKTQRAPR